MIGWLPADMVKAEFSAGQRWKGRVAEKTKPPGMPGA